MRDFEVTVVTHSAPTLCIHRLITVVQQIYWSLNFSSALI
jgi:hypothetical protein